MCQGQKRETRLQMQKEVVCALQDLVVDNMQLLRVLHIQLEDKAAGRENLVKVHKKQMRNKKPIEKHFQEKQLLPLLQ